MPKEDAYLRVKVLASIYLNEKTDKVMSYGLGPSGQARMAILLNLPDEQYSADKSLYDRDIKKLNWVKFDETYKKASASLRDMLNPRVLRRVEKHK